MRISLIHSLMFSVNHSTILGVGIGFGILLGAILVVVAILLYLKLKGKKHQPHNGSQVAVAVDGSPPIYYSVQNGSALSGLPSYSSEDPMTKVRPPDYYTIPNQPSQPQGAPAIQSQPPTVHINPRLQQLLEQHRPRALPPPVDT